MDFLKTLGGKIVTGLLSLGVIAGAISWFEMDPVTRHGIVSGTGRVIGWLGFVIVLPWATFFVIGQVARMEKNIAGAILVIFYTALEAALLAWLFSWSVKGATAVVFFCAAALLAGAYNLFTCDWIAERVG
jgi:hypothetical protein